ncbi:MAG TPA: oligosaccharide flippase family protein, partial [Stellaceae bacterium]|nr:oligosaccharide flippase family protein [Stellaceae bacterium]
SIFYFLFTMLLRHLNSTARECRDFSGMIEMRPAFVALSPHIGAVLRHAGWFAFFVQLAPIIGPRGYGLFVLAFSAIALTEALVTAPAQRVMETIVAPDERHWSTALVTMIVVGTMLSVIAFWSSAAIGAVVEDGGGDLVRSMSLLPLLGALEVIPRAALHRAGSTMRPHAADVAGLVAGGGVGLAFAWAGAGTWSLVAQIVVQRSVECTGLWLLLHKKIGIAWSRAHCVDLFDHAGCRSIMAAAPALARYGLILLVGGMLGPTAAGLYMLAGRLAHALHDIFLPMGAPPQPLEAVREARRVILPALLGSTLLATALPSFVDLRWWGAVPPAQLLLLGELPVAIGFVRAACNTETEWRWQAIKALGIVAAVAPIARQGLVAIAAAQLGWMLVLGLASLASIRHAFSGRWRALTADTVRPLAGAAAAAFLLCLLAEPVGLTLPPMPGLCLLTASGWLLYLVVRGDATGAAHAISARVGDIAGRSPVR